MPSGPSFRSLYLMKITCSSDASARQVGRHLGRIHFGYPGKLRGRKVVRPCGAQCDSSLWEMFPDARTVQGMARVRPGQAPAWPLSADRSVRRGSKIKRDFACTFIRHNSPVFVVLRIQSRLRLEGRTRTLSAPSPDLHLVRPNSLMPFRKSAGWQHCHLRIGRPRGLQKR